MTDDVTIANAESVVTDINTAGLRLHGFIRKEIDDALGHVAGDALLVESARRMRDCVRASDTVVRTGGDELLLVLPDVEAEGAAHVAEKLVARLTHPLHLEEHTLRVTCSLGITLSPGDGDTASGLIARADTAMYRAKQAGRNRYQFFAEQLRVWEQTGPPLLPMALNLSPNSFSIVSAVTP